MQKSCQQKKHALIVLNVPVMQGSFRKRHDHEEELDLEGTLVDKWYH